MKKLLLIFSLLIALNSYSQEVIHLSADKGLHIAGGTFWGAYGFNAGYGKEKNISRGIVVGTLFGLGIGIIKELSDSRTHEFDVEDVAATTLGGFGGSCVMAGITIILDKKK